MPKTIKASAPPHIFSEERARVHLSQIAQRPHPFESADKVRVTNYMIACSDSLRDMYGSGVIEVQTQNVTVNEHKYYDEHSYNALHEEAQIVNIALLVKGSKHDNLSKSNNGSSILISCHYDGDSYGPAARDGLNCATMLKVASVLSSSPIKLKRDVLFLFTDAKEVGLLGATIFFEEEAHPWSLLPSVAINSDNTGSCGKGMFQSSNSRCGAAAYLKYAVRPKAFSFSEWYDINVEDRWDDAVVYEKHGLHTMRMGSPIRWEYSALSI